LLEGIAAEVWDQFWANLAQMGAALALISGAVIAFVTVTSAHKQKKEEAVYRYLERQGTESFTDLATWVRSIVQLRPGETKEDAMRRYEGLAPTEQNRIWRFLDFWEEVSNVYLQGLFDEKIFRQMFAAAIIGYFRIFHWLVKYSRIGSDGKVIPEIWDGWEAVKTKMLWARVPHKPRQDSDPDPPPDTRDGWVTRFRLQIAWRAHAFLVGPPEPPKVAT
jgi:hypothetical protein